MNNLTTKNLCFVNNIRYKDMTIYSDRTTFITGDSGTGKSTLLKLLSYNTLPLNGEVLFNDKSIASYIPYEYRNLVSLGLQDVFLFSGTIEENFKKYYEYKEKSIPSKEVIRSLLETCILDLPIDKDVSEMSGGERQRLYISIVISFLPKFLLLDEPTAALDTNNASRVIQNLVLFAKENSMGLIIVSHDLALSQKYADEIIDLGGDGLVK